MTTLLAVDDSKTIRKVIEITFAGEDIETVVASSPDEAIEKLYQASPAVALVDVNLGHQDGYELCQRIKGEFPKTRVLLLSSKQNPYDASRAAAVGADDHLDKPFDTQVMIDKVRALVAAQPQVPASIQASPSSFGAPASELPVLEPLPELQHQVAIAELPVLEPAYAGSQQGSEELEAVTLEPPEPQDSAPPAYIPAAPRAASVNGAGAMVNLETRLSGLGLTQEQVLAVLALSKEVVEQAVWEVVPTLAETLIREEIARLTR